jgi:hypothetical protein
MSERSLHDPIRDMLFFCSGLLEHFEQIDEDRTLITANACHNREVVLLQNLKHIPE